MSDVYNRAYKCRIYPNDEQCILLAKTFGCVRYVYNYFLNFKKEVYEKTKGSVSYSETARLLVKLKEQELFLKEIDSIALQQSLRHLDTAYKNFFKNNADFPKFKKKRYAQSYSTVVVNNNIRLEGGYIKLPKLGFVKIKLHRSVPQDWTLKNVTVSRSATGKFYVSLLFEFEHSVIQSPVDENTNAIGLDFSMSELFVSSNGAFTEYQRFYKKSQDKLAKAQRKLSRCVKFSKNYYKQKRKVALIHEKITNQRKDFLHKLSREITNLYDVVCVESLDMKELSKPAEINKSDKPTKIHLGKFVFDNSWGTFTTFLKYKLEFEGKHFVKVDKWFASSQICNVCGYQNPELKDFSIREWACPECKTFHDRNINAAINIKREGLRLLMS